MKCWLCFGTGYLDGYRFVGVCPRCDGTGHDLMGEPDPDFNAPNASELAERLAHYRDMKEGR